MRTIGIKKEIFSKHESRTRVSKHSADYGMANLTMCTISKNKKKKIVFWWLRE